MGKRSRGVINWVTRHGVIPNLLMFALLVGGFIMATRIKQEVFPEFELDMITISVPYPGASPEEIEQAIILAIEESVRGIDGIKEMSSKASEGSGTVTLELDEGEDRQRLYQEVQEEVDRIRTFPEDAEKVQTVLVARKREVLEVMLYGDVSERVLREIAEQVRDRMLQSSDITQIELSGDRDFEISVEIKQDTLRAYNLTIEEVSNQINRMALELPGGSLKTKSGDILLRFKNRKDWAREFATIPIITSNEGGSVLLKDIADVLESFEDSDREASFNNQRTIGLEVYRVGTETPISVSDAVKKAMAEIEQELPAGVNYSIRRDRSDIFRQRLELLLKNAFMGLLLVFLFLGLFLEIRLAFWVTMGIPTSFLGALLFLPSTGVTINMISMFAFIVSLGIVVDDAIVAGENIYEYRQRGMNHLQAAIEGAKDVSIPVTFSILTNILAFLPLYMIPGFMGKIWAVIPTIVISVFAISWIESLLILPAHLKHRPPEKEVGIMKFIHLGQSRFAEFYTKAVERYYRPLLKLCLKRRYATLSFLISILIIVIAYTASGRLGMVLMPKVESDHSDVTAVLPYGSPLDRTREVAKTLVKTAKDIVNANGEEKLSEGIYARINSNTVEVSVYLTPPEIRPLSTGELTKLWREKTGELPGLESLKFESDRGGPGRGASLSVELSHRKIEVLDKASIRVAEELSTFPQVKDIDDGSSVGNPQYDFKLNEEGYRLGFTTYSVARQLRSAFYGHEAIRQQRGRNEIRVMVRYPREQQSIKDIENFLLRTPDGNFVPLKHVAEVKKGRAYTTIQRRNGRRVVTVSANVVPDRETSTVLKTLKESVLPKILDEFPGLTYSFEGRQAEMRDSLSTIGLGFIFALLGIYMLLAIPFRSYFQPLIVMCSIPFGVVGAILGHVLMGYSLSVISMFGILALAGVVVNDSLIMVDYANQVRKAGVGLLQAVEDAGVRRFRPIILTTMTTFGGLAPMIFETSRQARFMIPMAISLGYGILFATCITLILVPCLYLVVEDIKAFIELIKGILGMESQSDF